MDRGPVNVSHYYLLYTALYLNYYNRAGENSCIYREQGKRVAAGKRKRGGEGTATLMVRIEREEEEYIRVQFWLPSFFFLECFVVASSASIIHHTVRRIVTAFHARQCTLTGKVNQDTCGIAMERQLFCLSFFPCLFLYSAPPHLTFFFYFNGNETRHCVFSLFFLFLFSFFPNFFFLL